MASGRFENQMNFLNVVFGLFAIGRPSCGGVLWLSSFASLVGNCPPGRKGGQIGV